MHVMSSCCTRNRVDPVNTEHRQLIYANVGSLYHTSSKKLDVNSYYNLCPEDYVIFFQHPVHIDKSVMTISDIIKLRTPKDPDNPLTK